MKKSQSKINDIQEIINQNVEAHLRIANEEMASVQKDLVVVKNDIGWIKGKFNDFDERFDKLDNRVWWILGTIVLGFLANLYFK